MSAYDRQGDYERGALTLWVSCSGEPRQKSELYGHRFLLGRGLDCDVVLSDSAASREHAELLLIDNVWVLRDLDSTNGIFFMGRRQLKINLSDGDEIQIGGSIIRFGMPQTLSHASALPTVVRKPKGAGVKLTQRPPRAGVRPEADKTSPADNRRRRLAIIGGASAVLVMVMIWGVAGLSSKKPSSQEAVVATATPPNGSPNGTGGRVKPQNPSDKNKVLSLRHIENGRMFLQAGRLPDAVREFSRALELDPGNNLARIKLQKTIKRQQELARQSFERGMVNFKFLNYELAAQEWRQVLNLVPDPNDPLHVKALDSLDKVRKKLGR